MDGDLDNGKGSVIETEGRSGGALLPLLWKAWVVALGGAGLECRPGILGRDEYLHLCSCLHACICICTDICVFVLCNLICISYLYLYPGGVIPSCRPGKVERKSGNNITNTHSLNLRNNTSCVTQPNPAKSQRHPLIWKGLWPL